MLGLGDIAVPGLLQLSSKPQRCLRECGAPVYDFSSLEVCSRLSLRNGMLCCSRIVSQACFAACSKCSGQHSSWFEQELCLSELLPSCVHVEFDLDSSWGPSIQLLPGSPHMFSHGVRKTETVMMIFQHAQPALLYICPCVLLASLAVARARLDPSLSLRRHHDQTALQIGLTRGGELTDLIAFSIPEEGEAESCLISC